MVLFSGDIQKHKEKNFAKTGTHLILLNGFELTTHPFPPRPTTNAPTQKQQQQQQQPPQQQQAQQAQQNQQQQNQPNQMQAQMPNQPQPGMSHILNEKKLDCTILNSSRFVGVVTPNTQQQGHPAAAPGMGPAGGPQRMPLPDYPNQPQQANQPMMNRMPMGAQGGPPQVGGVRVRIFDCSSEPRIGEREHY